MIKTQSVIWLARLFVGSCDKYSRLGYWDLLIRDGCDTRFVERPSENALATHTIQFYCLVGTPKHGTWYAPSLANLRTCEPTILSVSQSCVLQQTISTTYFRPLSGKPLKGHLRRTI
jgi:hypothetical protein